MKKLFLYSILVVAILFSSNIAIIQAQGVSNPFIVKNTDPIPLSVFTTQYTALSASVFILGGSYSGNVGQLPITTYFQYKKDDSNFTTGAQETIPTVGSANQGTSGEFYNNPELKLDSTYYFRAVGYYNDTPNVKFYGATSSLRTGSPYPGNFPYVFQFDPQSSNNGTQQAGTVTSYSGQSCSSPKVYSPVSGCITMPTCPSGQVLNSAYTCVTPPAPQNVVDLNTTPGLTNYTDSTTYTDPETDNNVDSGTTSSSTTAPSKNIIPCATSATGNRPCEFKDIITIISNIMNFLLYFMVIPIAAIMFAYAGLQLVTSGGSTEKRGTAKKIFTNVAIGLIICAAAWLVVREILVVLGYDGSWIGF